MTVNKDNPNVELIFTSEAGTKIFALKDLTQISAFRGVAAEKSKRFAALCLTQDEMTELLQAQADAFNKKEFNVAAAIGVEMQFRNKMICEENSLLELVYIYLFIEGEDLDRPTQEYNKKKAALIDAQLDLKGFFLRRALELVDNFSLRQDVDLLNYLEETKTLVLKLSKFSPDKS